MCVGGKVDLISFVFTFPSFGIAPALLLLSSWTNILPSCWASSAGSEHLLQEGVPSLAHPATNGCASWLEFCLSMMGSGKVSVS